jgi:hypothetical protein
MLLVIDILNDFLERWSNDDRVRLVRAAAETADGLALFSKAHLPGLASCACGSRAEPWRVAETPIATTMAGAA